MLVGGDYQGKNPDIQNANITYFGPQASIKADATTNGDGGKVIVWADDTTRAHGAISARGGRQSGNGGFVETSGHQFLDVAGITVGTSAANGTAGNWLLDPNDVNIVHYGGPTLDYQISPSSPFAPTQADGSVSTLSDYTINQGLLGGNVTVATSSTGGGNGDITVTSATISTGAAASPRALTLQADRSIAINSSTITGNNTGGSLGVTLNSAYGGGVGNVQIVNSDIITYGGNLVIGGGSDPTTMAAIGYLGLDGVLIQGSGASTGYQIYANGGNITINGSSGTDGGPGVQINGGAHVITTGNGTITITGQGANGNDAILIKDASNTTISTVAGELKLDGSLNGSGGGYGVHISNGATVQTNSGPLNIIGQGGDGVRWGNNRKYGHLNHDCNRCHFDEGNWRN